MAKKVAMLAITTLALALLSTSTALADIIVTVTYLGETTSATEYTTGTPAVDTTEDPDYDTGYEWTNNWDFLYKLEVNSGSENITAFLVNNPYGFPLQSPGSEQVSDWEDGTNVSNWGWKEDDPTYSYVRWADGYEDYLEENETGYFAYQVDGTTDLVVGNVEYGANGSDWPPGFVSGPTKGPTPEPATLLLLGSGLFGLAAYGWRKKKKQS